MNLYPNLYALLESNSNARRLFDHAPPQVRRQLLVRQGQIRSVAALDAAIRMIAICLNFDAAQLHSRLWV